jgi:hypothetical protein
LHAFGHQIPLLHPCGSKGTLVYGYNCRSIFDALLVELMHQGKRTVGYTAMQHSSGIHGGIKRVVPEQQQRALDWDVRSWRPVPQQRETPLDVIVFTHAFGSNFDSSWCGRLASKPIVIEDAIQGPDPMGMTLDESVDVKLFSGGQDKLPTAMGGGVALFRSEALARAVAARIHAYPRESAWSRFLFLIKKLPTWLIYNCRIFTYLLIVCLRVGGISLSWLALKYRKGNSGFSHHGWKQRPSNGLLLALRSMFQQRATLMAAESTITRHTQLIWDNMDPHARKVLMPWYHKRPTFGCVYTTVRSPNLDQASFLSAMDTAGFVCLPQQSWKTDIQPLTDQLAGCALLPTAAQLSATECIRLAKTLNGLAKAEA